MFALVNLGRGLYNNCGTFYADKQDDDNHIEHSKVVSFEYLPYFFNINFNFPFS